MLLFPGMLALEKIEATSNYGKGVSFPLDDDVTVFLVTIRIRRAVQIGIAEYVQVAIAICTSYERASQALAAWKDAWPEEIPNILDSTITPIVLDEPQWRRI